MDTPRIEGSKRSRLRVKREAILYAQKIDVDEQREQLEIIGTSPYPGIYDLAVTPIHCWFIAVC